MNKGNYNNQNYNEFTMIAILASYLITIFVIVRYNFVFPNIVIETLYSFCI